MFEIVDMQMQLKSTAGITITLDVEPSGAIANVKAKIQTKIGIPPTHQCLIASGAGGQFIVLSEPDRTLWDYGVRNESTLLFLRVGMQIFAKVRSGIVIAFDVEADDKIVTVKAKIEAKSGMLISQQRLLFNGLELENGYTFLDYNIQNRSTLHFRQLSL